MVDAKYLKKMQTGINDSLCSGLKIGYYISTFKNQIPFIYPSSPFACKIRLFARKKLAYSFLILNLWGTENQYAMNNLFISESGLDARGVGPRIMLATSPFLAAAILLEIKSALFTEIFSVYDRFIGVFGWVWLSIGIAAFITAMVQFVSNFPKGKLITTGMYACSRNPIYASWAIFILPAVGVICNNWIFFAAALVMCIATSLLVKEEESQLLRVFGNSYAKYREKVGSIIRFL